MHMLNNLGNVAKCLALNVFEKCLNFVWRFCIKHVHIFTDNDLGWYFHLATAPEAPFLAFYTTTPKSLFWARTCIPGFEYAP